MLMDRFLGDDTLRNKDVDQALKRFHILLGEQVIVHGDSDEVDETTVQLQVTVDVPEWAVPVAMVEMSIAAEHLLDDTLHILVIVLRESSSFADPIILTTRK